MARCIPALSLTLIIPGICPRSSFIANISVSIGQYCPGYSKVKRVYTKPTIFLETNPFIRQEKIDVAKNNNYPRENDGKEDYIFLVFRVHTITLHKRLLSDITGILPIAIP